MKTANDEQVGGTHYRSAIQHWDFAAWHFGAAYFKGQITKYLTRWRKKGGVKDLEKAAHFLRKLIELPNTPPPVSIDDFIRVNEVGAEEAEIIRIVTIGGQSLQNAEVLLERLIASEPGSGYTDQ